MVTRFTALCACLFLSVAFVSAADAERKLLIVPTKLFAVESVVLLETTKDGKVKPQSTALTDKPIVLNGDSTYEVFLKPKGGVPVRVVDKLTVKPGETRELKVADVLGSVEVFGDNFPRASKIVLTDLKDDGPGEKGHVALQVAKEYRVEMAVPPGQYAVWVVPDNGAKPQRVVENVRVQAGRSTRVGD